MGHGNIGVKSPASARRPRVPARPNAAQVHQLARATWGRYARLAPVSPLEQRLRVLGILKRYGANATSFQILERSFEYWFDGDDACVAYVETGGAWVVAGAPIAALEQLSAVAERFTQHASERGRRACFFATTTRFCDRAPSFDAMQVGEQPVWDPMAWEDSVRASRSLREQLRRARAKGVVVRAVRAAEIASDPSPVRAALEMLVARWLGSREMASMGFLVDVEPFSFAEERRYLVAEREGAIVGMLAAVPVYARAGWLFEDLLRDPSAPNGTAELLVDAGMRLVAAEGSRYATLGLAPLAGTIGWLRLAREWSRALYDFHGVRAFKAKLRPNLWEPIFLSYPRGGSGNAALYDVLAAFARGSFARFGLRTLLRGPALVVRVLAALLVPWTTLIAASDAHRWFPWVWLKYTWIGFDVALVIALLVLASRWHAWLGTALAVAITVDSILTVVEALAFNVGRARSPLDWVVVAVSCAAPAFAAAVLWGAVGTRAAGDVG